MNKCIRVMMLFNLNVDLQSNLRVGNIGFVMGLILNTLTHSRTPTFPVARNIRNTGSVSLPAANVFCRTPPPE